MGETKCHYQMAGHHCASDALGHLLETLADYICNGKGGIGQSESPERPHLRSTLLPQVEEVGRCTGPGVGVEIHGMLFICQLTLILTLMLKRW
jgi:hypothetical protein